MLVLAGSAYNYTAEDFNDLFEDANMTLAQELAPYLIGNLSAKTATPGTHFYGFYGSGSSYHAVHDLKFWGVLLCRLIPCLRMLRKVPLQNGNPGIKAYSSGRL